MIAMALLACGESVARAAPVDEQEQRRTEWARQQALSRIFSIEEMRSQKVGAMISQEWKPRDLVYEDYMRRISAPVARRRSKRGQRRAAAKQWWVR